MAVKKTTEQIVAAFRLINTAKISKMEDTEKFALIKAVKHLKKVGTDFDDFLKDAQERLKPEDFDKIAAKYQSKDELTADETAALNKYNKDVNECVQGELDKEVELDFEPLSEEALGRFIASNDFTVAEIMTISDVIGA